MQARLSHSRRLSGHARQPGHHRRVDGPAAQSMSSVAPIDWSEIHRVVLVRLRSIGDTVLMTPCLSALKDWRPNLQIIAVLEPLAAPLLDGHPLVDRMIVVEKNAASRLAAIRTLRNSRPQIAFNLHGGTTAMLMASLCGARYSVGYDSLPGSWMANRRAPGPDKVLGRQKIHSVEQQLALLTWAGVPLPVKPRLNIEVSRPASERALAALKTINIDRSDGNSHNKAERFALIAPGAAF